MAATMVTNGQNGAKEASKVATMVTNGQNGAKDG